MGYFLRLNPISLIKFINIIRVVSIIALIVAQVTNVFECQTHMLIPNAKRLHLQSKAITTYNQLVDFDEEVIKCINKSFRIKGRKILNPNLSSTSSFFLHQEFIIASFHLLLL